MAESHFKDYKYTRSDLGNSELFLFQHGQIVKYSPQRRVFLLNDGKRFVEDQMNHVYQLAKQTVRSMYGLLDDEPDLEKLKDLLRFIMKSENQRSLGAMVDLAKSDSLITVAGEDFDTQSFLLNCENGTVDLRDGTLHPHRREDLLTKLCPVIYDPTATNSDWDRFLTTCVKGDLDLKSFLARVAGATLYGDNRDNILLVLHGPGSTGKSTFIRALSASLGDYSTTADFSTFLKQQRSSGGASDDLASLAGARLVSSIEVDEGSKLAEAWVKQMTGGDRIRARHLYHASFEFLPKFTPWLVCNHFPEVRHDDDAIWRRILRLPFTNVIPPDERDTGLKDILTNTQIAGPAILAWAVNGCVEWLKNGLQVPDSVRQATSQYKLEMNPLNGFVEDICILHRDAYTQASELRAAYDSWSRHNGEQPLNRNQLTSALRELGCLQSSRRSGRVWEGIGLQADAKSLLLKTMKTTTVTQLPLAV